MNTTWFVYEFLIIALSGGVYHDMDEIYDRNEGRSDGFIRHFV